MVRFGIIRSNAELIDDEQRGDIRILRYEAIGVTRRAAIRGAKKEASSLIPIPRQDVLNVTKIGGDRGANDAYIVTISN